MPSPTRPGLDPQPWHQDALCTQTDPEIFFPEKGDPSRSAKRVCSACLVREDCLAYALRNHEPFGIWGGLSRKERQQLENSAPNAFARRKRARNSAVLERHANGVPIEDIAQEFEISSRTVHRIVATTSDEETDTSWGDEAATA